MTEKNYREERVHFYHFLSRMFGKELTAELIAALHEMNLDGTVSGPEMRLATEELKAFLALPISSNADELAADYSKVFLAAGQAKGKGAFPYESFYTSPEKVLFQKAYEDMVVLFNEKGLSLESVNSDVKEDHIAAELLFMSYLVENGMDEEALAFLEKHLLNWTPDFTGDIQRLASLAFYPAISKLMVGFLCEEKNYLLARKTATGMEEGLESFTLSYEEADKILSSWKESYRVYGPKLQTKRSSKDVVRYGEISSFKEVFTDHNSDFSPKEIYYPIMQTMFYFNDKEVTESKLKDERDIIILMHPCDINAMRRLDNIFLKNGGTEDLYYKRLRDKVRVVLLECKGSCENAFCASVGSNRTNDYELALQLGEKVNVQIKKATWKDDFKDAAKVDYVPSFVEKNAKAVEMPVIQSQEDVKKATGLSFWSKYNDKCISCAGCNTVCPTCSCFDTQDIIYDETSPDGERRRIWSGCMLDTFTATAGGGRARKTPGENMRFKAMHKAYDYQKRFQSGENMCVGCGRCTVRCPKDIDFAEVLNSFAKAMKE